MYSKPLLMENSAYSWLAHPFAQFLYFHYLATMGMFSSSDNLKIPPNYINLSMSQAHSLGFQPRFNTNDSKDLQNEFTIRNSHGNPLFSGNLSYQNASNINLKNGRSSFALNQNTFNYEFVTNTAKYHFRENTFCQSSVQKKKISKTDPNSLESKEQKQIYTFETIKNEKSLNNLLNQLQSQKSRLKDQISISITQEEVQKNSLQNKNHSINSDQIQIQNDSVPQKRKFKPTANTDSESHYNKYLVKAIIQNGIGVKPFIEYVDKYGLDRKIKRYYCNTGRYQKVAKLIMTNAFRKMQTFLQLCSVKIIKAQNKLVSKIILYMLDFKLNFSSQETETLFQILKSTFSIGKVFLTKNSVLKLYQMLKKKVEIQQQIDVQKALTKYNQHQQMQQNTPKSKDFLTQKVKKTALTLKNVKKSRFQEQEGQSLWTTNMDWELMEFFKFQRNFTKMKEYYSNYYENMSAFFSVKQLKQRVLFLFKSTLAKLKFFIGKYKVPHFYSFVQQYNLDLEEKVLSEKYKELNQILIEIYQQKDMNEAKLFLFIKRIVKQVAQCDQQQKQILQDIRSKYAIYQSHKRNQVTENEIQEIESVNQEAKR